MEGKKRELVAGTIRCVSPIRDGKLFISFDLETGTILQITIPVESARFISEAIADYLAGGPFIQLPKSSGIPSVEVSTPHEGVKV